jgi:RNA polymerase sigma-70 factor (ECF subfamily)
LSRGSAISELIQQVRTTTALRARSRDEFQQLRDALSADDQTLLILRIDKGLSFREVAQVMDDGAAGDEERLERETARLRKRLQLIRKKLHTLARQRGLVPR